MAEPLTIANIMTHEATVAYDKVLKYAGCSKVRDDIDKRIIEETSGGTAYFKGLSKYNGEGDMEK